MAGKHTPVKAARPKRPSRMMNTSKKANANIGSKTSSPLLSLPPEIRNRIYGYVLGGNDLHVQMTNKTRWARAAERQIKVLICSAAVDDKSAAHVIRYGEESIEISDWRTRHRWCRDGRANSVTSPAIPPYSVALLQTCSQIHGEAALLPLKMNTFLLDNNVAFSTFEKQLIPVQKRAITTISIEGRALYALRMRNSASLSFVKTFTGLKNVTVFEELGKYNFLRTSSVGRQVATKHLRRRLSAFVHLSLDSATICLYHQQEYDPIADPPDNSPRTDPDLFNTTCEELESMLLAKPDSEYG